MSSTATPTHIPVGSYVHTADGERGYFAGVTGSLYAIQITPERVIGVSPADVNITHVPGFMAEDDNGEIRYYLLEENARDWSRVRSPPGEADLRERGRRVQLQPRPLRLPLGRARHGGVLPPPRALTPTGAATVAPSPVSENDPRLRRQPMAHKTIEEIRYHETVYYDDAGEEVDRVRHHDDSLYDSEGPFELTDAEREDYL